MTARVCAAPTTGGRGLGPLHLVSAWAQTNRLVLAQTAVEDDSNEITAIPELLRMLCLEGCIVTLDAMGCQKKIARQIRAQEADYVLRVRANHQGLHGPYGRHLRTWNGPADFADCPHDYADTVGKDHGPGLRPAAAGTTGDPAYLAHVDPDREWWRPGQPWSGSSANAAAGTGSRPTPAASSPACLPRPTLAAGGATALEHRERWVLDVAFGEDDSRHPHGLRRPQHGHPQAHRAQPSMLANSSLHRRPPVEAARA